MMNPHKSLVIEIIGPAGAGKSTLYKTLGKTSPDIQNESLPPVWNISHFPFFIKNILSLTPTLIRLPGKGDRNLTRRELAWMAILNGWPEILGNKVQEESKVILLDQGPIFLITVLLGFGPQCLNQPSLRGWWEKIYERWAQTLDLVVWLDSTDETLTGRIRERESEHLVKGKSDQEVYEFLAKFRVIYENVVKQILVRNPQMKVLRIDTGKFSLDEVVDKVISEIKA
jgi:shikimate kinase